MFYKKVTIMINLGILCYQKKVFLVQLVFDCCPRGLTCYGIHGRKSAKFNIHVNDIIYQTNNFISESHRSILFFHFIIEYKKSIIS
jgi:hypothetical protein